MPSFGRVLTIVAVVLGAGFAPADNVTRQSIVSGGLNRTYYLYVPPGLGDTPSPLIVMLHGSGRRGDVLLDVWKRLAKKERVILAGPDSTDARGWRVPDDGPALLYDLVEAIKREQRVDARRVYLFGHSAGAVFGLYMGLVESRYFAAVAVSAGAFRSPQEFTILDLAKRKIPFAVFVGTDDRFFPPSAVHATRDAFLEAGFPFDLTEMKGHDHNYYGRADEIDKGAWKFLSAQSLPSEPVFDPDPVVVK